jgi:putative DNA primase/helicase
MKNLFPKAKQVALSSALQWLPSGGKIEGDEYRCLNPLRVDSTIGSFSINLKSGKWADFADDMSGNDLVSCYAYLNRSSLEMVARDSGYKNIEGGIQAEAAREIIITYDSSYFPGVDDDFSRPIEQEKKGPWDGFTQITTGLRDAIDPMETLLYHERYNGAYSNHWTFTDKRGKPMFIVARYYKEKKKEDRPFTPWTDGTNIRWRSKNLEGVLLPLYNLVGLESNQNLPVLLLEGQKNAEQSRTVLDGLFVTSSVYRSPKKTDLEPLRGRTVYYWFDPDGAGRKKLKEIKKLLTDIDCRFFAIHSPVGKPKGWDISNAIDVGWGASEISEHIKDQQGKPLDRVHVGDYVDDFQWPFKIVGQNSENIFFFPKETCILMKFKRTQIGKSSLMSLMDVRNWGDLFQKAEGNGVDWDMAANEILRKASQAPIYSDTMVRRSGMWRDDGRLIAHAGDKLFIDGEDVPLFDAETEYIYERNRRIPFSIDNPLTTEESAELANVTQYLDVESPEMRLFFSGWLLLAPFGGVLGWRPSVWIIGAKGSGKSHIFSKIVDPIIGDFSVSSLGSSTSAGIKQHLDKTSIPTVMDEFEGDNQKKKELITDILNVVRQSSSGADSTYHILQGTADKGGTTLNIQSMFMFASIGANLVHSADASRIALVKLRTPLKALKEKRNAQFKKMVTAEKMITKEWASSFHARTLRLLPTVIKTVELFRDRAMLTMGTNRSGDQYGTLLGGAWMINHDTVPSIEEVDNFLRELKVESNEASNREDEATCMEYILSSQIEVSKVKKTVGVWLLYWFSSQSIKQFTVDESFGEFNFNVTEVKSVLGEYGIKPISRTGQKGPKIQIAVNHPNIKRFLRETPWEENYSDMIQRLKFCSRGSGSTPFGSLGRKGFSELDAVELFAEDEVPF